MLVVCAGFVYGQPKTESTLPTLTNHPIEGTYKKPVFTGNPDGDFYEWAHEQYREPKSVSKRKLQGTMVFRYTVDETGQVKDVETVETYATEASDRFADILTSSPLWDPATVNGKPVAVKQTMTVTYHVTSFLKNMEFTTPVSAAPLFDGAATPEESRKAFGKWVNDNLGFPYFARNIGVRKSRVLVTATIDRHGNIVNPNVTLSPAKSLSRKARKMLLKSPKWQPGVDMGGQTVNTQVEFEFWFTYPSR